MPFNEIDRCDNRKAGENQVNAMCCSRRSIISLALLSFAQLSLIESSVANAIEWRNWGAVQEPFNSSVGREELRSN